LRNIIFQLIVVFRHSLLIHFIVWYVLYIIDHILFSTLKTVVPAGLVSNRRRNCVVWCNKCNIFYTFFLGGGVFIMR